MHPVAVANWVNLTTPLGLGLAGIAGCRISWRDDVCHAVGYRWPFPVAGAFTLGGVVLSRGPLDGEVWEHELAHARQYAWCGPAFLPLYTMACAWSLLRTGDWWSRNIFERRAGLSAGGYRERPVRRVGRRWRGGTAVAAAGA